MKKRESGNVLFVILITVGLFALLTAAITRDETTTATYKDDESAILATELVQYAQSVKSAIDRVQMRNGCSDDQLSFENDRVDPAIWNYANPRAPADFSCHIFHPNGGGIDYKILRDDYIGNLGDAQNPNATLFAKAKYPLFAGHTYHTRYTTITGGYDADIMMIVSFINYGICQALHNQLDVPFQDHGGEVSQLFFDQPLGPYRRRTVADPVVGGLPAHMHGSYTGCVRQHGAGAASGGYQFYYLLKNNNRGG